MKSARPVNLDLLTIKLPMTAVASILHRISGLILFLALPLIFYALAESLDSPGAFLSLQNQLKTPWGSITTWGILTAVSYHIIAGLRHLLMDMGFGERLQAGQRSASLVIFLSILASFGLGIWLW